MSNDLKLRFRPVQGNDKKIKETLPLDGYIYFATDTKKIYCGKNGQFIPMGGNTGIYYGSRALTDAETESEIETLIFSMNNEDIESDMVPNENDLILNTPDGCFYRIVNIYEEDSDIKILGSRLTIAGSGGGGGGTGSGTSVPVVVDPDRGIDRYFVTSKPNEMNISFYGTTQTEDNYIAQITYYLGNSQIYVDNSTYQFGAENLITFNLAPYLNSFISTSVRNSLAIKITDAYGNSSLRKVFNFYMIELNLRSNMDIILKTNKSNGNSFAYDCVPSGGIGLDNRYIQTKILNNKGEVLLEEQFRPTLNENNRLNISLDPNRLQHGVYQLEVVFCGIIPTNTTEIIESSILKHSFIYFNDENENTLNLPIIATHLDKTTIQQYDTVKVWYYIADPTATTLQSTAIFKVNSEENNSQVDLNKLSEKPWTKLFLSTGTYNLSLEYAGTAVVEIGTVNVIAYDGDMPTIDSSSKSLLLNFTALGRNNNEVKKDEWSWTVPGTQTIYTGQFEKFLWGEENGWVQDNNNNTALKLTNGAKFSIPNFHPFATEASKTGLTIELDFMVSGVLDYSKSLINCLSYNTNTGNIVVGFNVNGQKATFNSSTYQATSSEITDDVVSSGNMALQAFTQYFNEDSRIHLTYVIEKVETSTGYYYVNTYLNGILSGIMKIEAGETFIDAIGSPSFITLDSEFGDIYLYNLRVYDTALSTRGCLNNYIADIPDIEEKINAYAVNNIFDDETGLISLNAINQLTGNSVPYVLLTGGCKMEKNKEDSISFASAGDLTYRLPLSKSDYRLMSMEMKIPGQENSAMNIPLKLQDSIGNIVTSFDDIQLNTLYSPMRGVQVYGQGTSSMVYPTKNLRIKFILEEDYPTVYDGSCPVEIVCLKADYMDSSSSHNTGTGNLIYDLYTNLGLRTPPQQFVLNNANNENISHYDIVTAIKGYPIICFYSDDNGQSYSYIGRYNFNLDKTTPEPFGFIPQYFYTGETIQDNNGNDRKVIQQVGYEIEIINEKQVFPLNEDGEEIHKDIVQCWEMLNNDSPSPTKFLTAEGFSNFTETLEKNNNWMNYYEDRYPDELVGIAEDIADGKASDEDIDLLNESLNKGIYRVAKWLNSTATDASEVTNSTLPAPVYYQTLDEEYDINKDYYRKIGAEYEKVLIEFSDNVKINLGGVTDYPTGSYLINSSEFLSNELVSELGQYIFLYDNNAWTYLGTEILLSNFGITLTTAASPTDGDSLIVTYSKTNNWSSSLLEKYTNDTKDYRLSKFKDEFTDYFDMDFCLFYYILTMILLMMDSRAKNMMIASWDQTIWYPIFYDMDTMLGLNNTGFNKFSFDVEDDPADKIFNGWDSVLWNNFRECFYKDICFYYAQMRNSGLTLNKLLEIYNDKGADSWSQALSSADAEYKYVSPYENGYIDGSGENLEEIDPGEISYLYAAQGPRSNHRIWWLSNRLNYFDSKYLPITYGDNKPSGTSTFNFRAYALPEQQNSALAEECVAQTPPNHQFELTALNNSYQSLFIGNIIYSSDGIISAGEKIVLGPEYPKHEVESYILNPSLISDLGDLSDKYLGSFHFPATATRLTKLKFGRSSRSNPNSYDKYYNSLLNSLNIGSSCPYLKELNVSRCTGLRTLNLSANNRLQILDAEKSGLTNIVFPVNSILKKLYLPTSLTSLTLIDQTSLEIVEFDEGDLNIDSMTLQNLGEFNSYDLVKKNFINRNNNKYLFNDIYWEITENTVSNNILSNIDILDALLTNGHQPLSALGAAASLTGTVKLALQGVEVNEYEIYNKYHNYFPNLTFIYDSSMDVTSANTITFYNDSLIHFKTLVDGDNTTITLNDIVYKNGIPQFNNPTKLSSVSHTYTFSGYWYDEDSQIYYYDANKEVIDTALSETAIKQKFENKQIDTSINLKAIYLEQDREYLLTYYNYDNTIIGESISLPYGTVYSDLVSYVFREDDESLLENQRWSFKGWTKTNQNNNTSINPILITEIEITSDIDLYAYFIKEDCTKVATDLKYFNFKNVTIDNVNGYQISIKNEYRNQFKGKITLPDKYLNTDIISVGDFKDMIYLTHIYFINSNYLSIAEKNSNTTGFAKCSQLVKAFLPDTVKIIGDYAFLDCINLEEVGLNDNIYYIGERAFGASVNSPDLKVTIQHLPSNLTHLGSFAFYHGGRNITAKELPKGITHIRPWTFAFCSGLGTYKFGVENDDQLENIDTAAFYGAGSEITQVYIGSKIKTINTSGTKPFMNYGNNTGGTVYINNLESYWQYEVGITSIADFGFNLNSWTAAELF